MNTLRCKFLAGLLLFAVLVCGGCSGKNDTAKKPITSIEQLNDPAYVIGVSMTPVISGILKSSLPKPKAEYFEFMAGCQALQQGKIDAYVVERLLVNTAIANGLKGVKLLPGIIGDPINIGIGISRVSKIPDLKAKINTFLAELKSSGIFDDMWQRWCVDRNYSMPNISVPEKSDTTLTVATTGITMPFSFYQTSGLTGFDIELARRFAKWLGAKLEFQVYDYNSIIAVTNTGKVDCVMAALYITPETAEVIDYSDVLFSERMVVIIQDKDYHGTVPEKTVQSVQAFNGKRIAVATGGVHGSIVQELLPDAKLSYFDNYANITAAILAGKVDAFVEDEPIVMTIERENSSFTHLPEYLRAYDNAFVFAKSKKGDKLRDDFNKFLASLKDGGTLESIRTKWMSDNDSLKTIPDYENLPDTNGTLKIALDTTLIPFAYIENSKITGYDVDIITRFCKEAGLKPDFVVMDFSGILQAVHSGKCDIAIGAITITDERKESVNFSDSVYTGGNVIMYLKPQTTADNSRQPAAPAPAKSSSLTIADFNGKRIGVVTGSIHDATVKKRLSGAKILYFDNLANAAAAMLAGKIDAVADDEPVVRAMEQENSSITHLREYLQAFNNAFIFRKSKEADTLRNEFNEFLAPLKADGTLDRLRNKWLGEDESAKTVMDYENLPATNGTLKIAFDNVLIPFTYVKDGRNVGYDVEIISMFCKARGYKPEMHPMNFASVLASVQSGKSDIGIGSISITEERKQTLNFSDTVYTGGDVLIYLKPENEPAAAPAQTLHTQTVPAQKKSTARADLNGKRIGVPAGMDEWTTIIKKLYPDAKVIYYNSIADITAALVSGKIDAFPCDSSVLDLIMSQNKKITALDEDFSQGYEAGVAFPKNDKGKKLKAQWDEFITSIKNDGRLDALIKKWTGSDESAKTIPDYASLPAENGVLRTAACADYEPFTYYRNNELAGIEVDLAVNFCKAYGYGLKIDVMSFDGILASVQSGKNDFAVSALSLTDEHAENLLFSVPYYTFRTKIAVLAQQEVSKTAKIAYLNGKDIGVASGVPEWAYLVKKELPDSKIIYYNSMADLVAALESGKIDAFPIDDPVIGLIVAENSKIASLGSIDESFDIAVALPKTERGRKLKVQWDEFITSIKSEGKIDALVKKWASAGEEGKTMLDYSSLPAINGTVKMATDGEYPPFNYYRGTKLAGFEVELAVLFAQKYGYALKISTMSYDAILAAVQSGKCDFGLDGMSPQGEHSEAMLFSVPYHSCTTHMVVRADSIQPAQTHPSADNTQPAQPRAKYSDIPDLAGKRIAVATGTTHPQIAKQYVPTAELVYFDSITDAITALKAGKVDAACSAIPIIKFIMAEDDSYAFLGEQLTYVDCAPIFAKNDWGRKLCDQFSEFLKAQWDNGTIQEIDSIWFGMDESRKVIKDYSQLPSPNGTLKMAVDTTCPPFVYIKDNKIVGYDVDCAVRFCEAYGYGLEILPINAQIQAVISGKCDFAMSGLTITPERKENVLFSYPNMHTGNAFVVRKEDAMPQSSEHATHKASPASFKDFAGKKIAVITGTAHPHITLEAVPDAKLVYVDSLADTLIALKAGKVDAACANLESLPAILAENDGLALFSEPLSENYAAPVFAKTEKGRKLCDQFSSFVKPLWDNGTIEQVYNAWFGPDESRKVVKDYTKLPATNGTLKLAVDTAAFPSVYLKDNKIVGYDIDLITRFCEAYGYGLEIVTMNVGGIIPAVMSGKADIGTNSFGITEERKENVLFSYPFLKGGNVLLVRKENAMPQSSEHAAEDYHLLDGKRIAVITGSNVAEIAAKVLPDAVLSYFENFTDPFAALRTGKVDAVCIDIPVAEFIASARKDIVQFGKPVEKIDCAPIFPKTDKGRRLCEEYSGFIKSLEADGSLKAIEDKWLRGNDAQRVVKDYTKLPAVNGKLKMAAELSSLPYAYVKDNFIVGYDIDIAVRFCEAYGYGLEIMPMTFTAIIPALVSGKCDFSSTGIAYTPERAETVLFSYPVLKSGVGFFVMDKSQQNTSAENAGFEKFAGKRIGAMTGTPNGDAALKAVPTAKIEYFDNNADLVTALKFKRIDAVSMPINTARFLLLDNEDLAFFGKPLLDFDAAPIFAKTDAGKKLCEQYSAFIQAQWDNGTIKALDDIWFSKDETKRTAKDYASLPATNGKLKMAVDTSLAPFAYVKNNTIVGYEIDLAVKFCQENGYGLEVVPMNFGAIIPAVQSGKCDFASCSIAITPERAEQVLFGRPNAKTGCILVVRKADTQSSAIAQLAGKKIGVQTATMNAQIVADNIPTAQIVHFDALPDILLALKSGKIEAICCSIFAARHMMLDNDDITYIDQMLTAVDLAPIFTSSDKGHRLREEYSSFVKGLWDDGTISKIDALWLGKNEAAKTIEDFSALPAPNGTLKMAVDPAAIPFTYTKEGKVTGYDIDIAVRFCKAKGYGLEIVPMNFAAIIPAVQSGKCDFSSCITYTEERAKSVLYSAAPNAHSGNVIVVLKDKTAPAAAQAVASQPAEIKQSAFTENLRAFMEEARVFIDDLKASVNRTFIREERWKLFVEGIINTMMITILAIVCGTALGFFVYLFCRGGNIFANLITRFFIWLIQGMPMVVLLMILYYVIFGSIDIDGIWVAVIAFTMTFGAAVYGMLLSGTGALDKGQTEAAYALGFTDSQTFFTVILPQAALHFMPAYKAEVVALIKATAIVGYIAVQDLTKMGDIVRSRTYEAFFPLIAVAAIYFVLAGILNIIVGIIHNRIRPEKRTKNDILRGIDTHDKA